MDLRKKKIIIYGLWHLGSVTAGVLAKEFENIIGLDEKVTLLKKGKAPLYEPGLDVLIQKGLKKGSLSFTKDLSVIEEGEIIWICFDTPVDDQDKADVLFIKEKIRSIFSWIQEGAILLLSSQVPVGTVRRLKKEYEKQYPKKKVHFAYSPENLRLGEALKAFRKQERIVIGADFNFPKERLERLLTPFTNEILWVSIESAEMAKHALNAFLALCITYTNELATLCEKVGANPYEVEKALRKESRVGEKAFIHPGESFGGGTLARDIKFLMSQAKEHALQTKLINTIIESNEHHKLWVIRSLKENLKLLKGKKIALLGLAYKPNTNATRRSTALYLCQKLLEENAFVFAFDPQVKQLPKAFEKVKICETIDEVFEGAHALILATKWEEFQILDPKLFDKMHRKMVIDQSGFFFPISSKEGDIQVITLGKNR